MNVAHFEEFGSDSQFFFLKIYPLDSSELSEYCYGTEFNILICLAFFLAKFLN
jgi:hypothetical protein